MEGIAARSSVRNTSGARKPAGHNSEMKMAIPSAIGVEISSARIDEYRVPHRNGSAPKSPDTGSQLSVRQNANPNFVIDSHDCRTSS